MVAMLGPGLWSVGRVLPPLPVRATIIDQWDGYTYCGTTPPHWFPTGDKCVTLRLDDGTQIRMNRQSFAAVCQPTS